MQEHSLPRYLVLSFLVAALCVGAAWAAAPDDDRNFDARVAYNKGFAPEKSGLELRAQAFGGGPDLSVTLDHQMGTVRAVSQYVGFLTDARSGTPFDVALDYVRANLDALGLTPADLAGYEVTDSVYSKVTGATHIYLRQTHRGLAVYNGQLHVNVNRDNRIMSVNNAFVGHLARSVNSARPEIDAVEAVVAVADHLGVALDAAPRRTRGPAGTRRVTGIDAPGLSADPITAELQWLPIRAGETRLVWCLQVRTPDGNHWYDLTVDAENARVWTRFDWVASGSYRVYEQPVESPIHTTPLPPADARTLAVNPEEATASPIGWFSGGVMDGNNVHACVDANANNVCDTPQASCSGTTCDFPINLSTAPSNSRPAAVTNLFYWNNIVHDVQYQYGFDEAAGNFQEDNFGRGGAGSDSVNADAQDGSGNCNANFATPVDGFNPRMQMFLCNAASPSRDGDFDNGVIVHEYGHGISNRQVGGPNNVSCLNNAQQPGEGWSDWFGLVYTAEVGDSGTDVRGIGSYLFNLPPDGTIRNLPYSTDPAVNNWTYQSIQGASIPHGVGSRWAQAIWEVYWALVDKHGFDPDLYNATGGAGNQRAMLYVNEGLKNTACSPTFLLARNGITIAAEDNYGGEDLCTVWEAFAAFGLGTNASTPGPNSTSATNGFLVPEFCLGGGDPAFQAGIETIDEVIRTVSLTGFTDPIVVMGPPSFNGSQPTTVRVRNVTTTSFQHSLQEWDYLDGSHVNESIGYLVVNAGNSDFGGLDVEAGAVNINHNWTSVTFNQPFASAPVVIAQVVTFNGGQAVTTRLRNVSATGFDVRLQEEEANDGTHAIETVHYVAMEKGSATVGGRSFVVGNSGNSVTHLFSTINFSSSVTNPAFIGDMQTFDGNNPATVRHRNLTSTSVEVKIEEEQSLDAEVEHTTEDVGYILVEN